MRALRFKGALLTKMDIQPFLSKPIMEKKKDEDYQPLSLSPFLHNCTPVF